MSKEWKECELGNLLNVKHGYAFKGEFFCDEKTRELLVTPGNFAVDGGFQNLKKKYYKGPIPKDYVLNPGDLVITMTDLSKESDTLGYGAIIPSDENIWLHNQRIGLVELKNNTSCDLVYLSYYFRSNVYRGWIIGSATGTTVKHTAPKKIHSFRAKLPPLAEQKAIAKILGDLDAKIELNRKMNQTLENMAQALFNSWFVDFDPVLDNALAAGNLIPEPLQAKAEIRKKVRSDVGILPESQKEIQAMFPDSFVFNEDLGKWIPEGWEVIELESLVKHQKGFAFKSSWYQEQGHIVVRVSDTTADSIDINSCNKISKDLIGDFEAYSLKENDVVIATVGSWPPNYSSVVGKVIKVPRTVNGGLLNQNAVRLRVGENYDVHQGFLYLNLKNSRFMEYIINRSQGSANQASITLKSIFKYLVVMPNKDVLKMFSKKMKLSFDRQNSNLEQMQSLSKQRDVLLPQLVSGKVRVPQSLVEQMEKELEKEKV